MSTLRELREAFEYLAGDGTEYPAESLVVAEEKADRPRPRRRRWAVAGVTAVVVAGVVSAVVVVQSDRSDSVAPTPAATRAPDANRAAAEAEADRLVELVPRPAGAVESDTAPFPALAQDDHEQFNAVSRRAWWTAAVTLQDAITTVTTSLPDGLTARVLGAEPGSSLTRIQIEVPSDPPLPRGVYGPDVIVDLIRHGDLVGAFVQAAVPWTPVSTHDPLVPSPVAAVEVTSSVKGSPDLHHTLTPDQATALVDLVDSEPAGSLEANCPFAGDESPTDELRVPTASGIFGLFTQTDGCGFLSVTAPNGYVTLLQGGGQVHDRIVALFDLPDRYR